MATKIVMPRLGWTMEEGTFVEWNKEDGAQVKKGDILFTVEGDKAIQEVESFADGILRIAPDGPQADDVVAVGALLGYLVEAGEEVPLAEAAEVRVSEPVSPSTTTAPVSTLPRDRSTGRGGPTSSPRARRVAAQLGIDWTMLKGSGRSGRIVERDVQAAARVDLPPGEHLPITPIRRLIAERMVASGQIAAPVTLTTEADATELVAWRQQARLAARGTGRPAPSYNDLLVKLTALTLEQHPRLNAVWTDRQIVLADQINIGLAVDTEAGLLVPVVRQVESKSLEQIAADSGRLVKGAQNRSLAAEDLQGATFTITNLGMYGIDAFTPIIDLPQCAILGVGRILLKPAVHDGEVVPRQMVALSLTFDHRLVDGGPAARFLNRIRLGIEQPQEWLGARAKG